MNRPPAKTPGSLRQRLRAAAAEAMLDSAERAMVRRGYDRATMAQIAAETGCATGTFYLHFKNKEELFEAIAARHLKAMFDLGRPVLEGAGEPLDKVRHAWAVMLHYVLNHRPFFRLFFAAMPLRHRALVQTLTTTTRQRQEEYDRLELELLRQAQKAGRIRRDLPVDILQEFMTALSLSMAEQFVFSPGKQSVDEQMKILWGLVTGGIGART